MHRRITFLFLALSAATASAALAPYSENFNDDPVGTAPPSELAPESGTFSETYRGNADATGDGSFFVVANAGGRGYRNASGISAGSDITRNFSSTLSFSNLASSSFSISTEFSISSLTSSGDTKVTFGLGAFGSLGHFASGGRYELRYTVDPFASDTEALGSLRLEEIGGDGQVNATSVANVPVQLSTTYTMTLIGNYAAGTMNFSGTLTRLGATASVAAVDTTPLAGTNFGYLLNDSIIGAGTAGQDVTFDNFAVANVPEPGSAMLLLGGIALLGARRRR